MTNYERIKSMTIEEMAEFIRYDVWCNKQCWKDDFITCSHCIEEYLESEVEE